MKAEQGGAEPRLRGKLTRSGAEDFNDYKSDERTGGGCKAELVKRNLSGNSAEGTGEGENVPPEEKRKNAGAEGSPARRGAKWSAPRARGGSAASITASATSGPCTGGRPAGGGASRQSRGGRVPRKERARSGGGRAHRCPECGKGYTYLTCFLNHERICRAESESDKKRGTGSLEPQGLRGAARQRRRETRQRRRETRQRCRETRQRRRETRQRRRETRQRCRETRGGDARDGEPAPREHSRQVKKEEEERGKGKHGRERGVTRVKQEVTSQKIHAAPRGDSAPPTGMETRIKEERVEVELEHRGEERRTELGKGGEEREEAEVSRWGCGEEKHRGTTEPQVARASRDAHPLDCLDCGAAFLLESQLHQHYMDHARGGGLNPLASPPDQIQQGSLCELFQGSSSSLLKECGPARYRKQHCL
ncbi:hypothetical protein EOD39_17852 [Acipenser ruthenus]|uniref:C2H2-type domain-containing protein n=1 Tax=Acipenser ruthenus TaxID=7906 RepID=A0A444V2E9_ACIRT|nr:hypothetical protein EOD39_17852 [Acipenser ruthenus]